MRVGVDPYDFSQLHAEPGFFRSLPNGGLFDGFRFDVHVYPLWNPTLVKVRY